MQLLSVNILRAAALTESSAFFLPARNSDFPNYSAFPDPITNLAHNALAHLLAPSPHRPLADSLNPLLILGTTLGCLETDREFDRSRHPNPRHASPAAFAKTLPSTLPAQLALTFHLTAPSLVLSAGNASAALALRRAAIWMHHLNLPHAIAGGFAFITENPSITPTCQAAMLLLSRERSEHSLGTISLNGHNTPDLSANDDASLRLIINWLQEPTATTLPAGVTLTP